MGNSEKELYVILLGTDMLSDGSIVVDFVSQTRPLNLYLLEYEIRNANNTAGVADDMFLLLNFGDLRGGDVTFSSVGMNTGTNDLPLSTNSLTNSGAQRLQNPVLIARNSQVSRRRITFKLRDENGVGYVPLSNNFRVLLRFRFTQELHSLDTINLASWYAKQAWAQAGN